MLAPVQTADTITKEPVAVNTENAQAQNTRTAAMIAMKARAPEIGKAFGPFFQGLMKEGALSVKQKELIALGIATAVRCDGCIDAHVEKCIKAGATSAEVMEAAGVAVMMGGGPAYMYAPVVAAAVERFTQA